MSLTPLEQRLLDTLKLQEKELKAVRLTMKRLDKELKSAHEKLLPLSQQKQEIEALTEVCEGLRRDLEKLPEELSQKWSAQLDEALREFSTS